QNTGGAHGSSLDPDEVKAVKELLGFDPEQTFQVDAEVLEHTRKLRERGRQARDEWQQAYDTWAEANPDGKQLHERMIKRELTPGWQDALPVFDADEKGVASRAASGEVLTAIAP